LHRLKFSVRSSKWTFKPPSRLCKRKERKRKKKTKKKNKKKKKKKRKRKVEKSRKILEKEKEKRKIIMPDYIEQNTFTRLFT